MDYPDGSDIIQRLAEMGFTAETRILAKEKDVLERLRREYPVGCRVELLQMDDAAAPPVGTTGTVTGIDSTGANGQRKIF